MVFIDHYVSPWQLMAVEEQSSPTLQSIFKPVLPVCALVFVPSCFLCTIPLQAPDDGAAACLVVLMLMDYLSSPTRIRPVSLSKARLCVLPLVYPYIRLVSSRLHHSDDAVRHEGESGLVSNDCKCANSCCHAYTVSERADLPLCGPSALVRWT